MSNLLGWIVLGENPDGNVLSLLCILGPKSAGSEEAALEVAKAVSPNARLAPKLAAFGIVEGGIGNPSKRNLAEALRKLGAPESCLDEVHAQIWKYLRSRCETSH